MKLEGVDILQAETIIPNLKSRTALTAVYAAGLRVSEVILLKIADIDRQRMVTAMNAAGGAFDRLV